MINLLPDEVKRDIGAARTNVILLRYNILALVAIAFIFGLCLLFYVFLNTTQTNAKSTSTDNTQKAANYSNVSESAEKYRNNLTIAKKILDDSVNFTDIIFSITKLLPDGVVLDLIDISTANFGQQTTFTAHASSYAKAMCLKKNFQDSALFSNVYLQNISDTSNKKELKGQLYPIGLSLSAKLNKVEKQAVDQGKNPNCTDTENKAQQDGKND